MRVLGVTISPKPHILSIGNIGIKGSDNIYTTAREIFNHFHPTLEQYRLALENSSNDNVQKMNKMMHIAKSTNVLDGFFILSYTLDEMHNLLIATYHYHYLIELAKTMDSIIKGIPLKDFVSFEDYKQGNYDHDDEDILVYTINQQDDVLHLSVKPIYMNVRKSYASLRVYR